MVGATFLLRIVSDREAVQEMQIYRGILITDIGVILGMSAMCNTV